MAVSKRVEMSRRFKKTGEGEVREGVGAGRSSRSIIELTRER